MERTEQRDSEQTASLPTVRVYVSCSCVLLVRWPPTPRLKHSTVAREAWQTSMELQEAVCLICDVVLALLPPSLSLISVLIPGFWLVCCQWNWTDPLNHSVTTWYFSSAHLWYAESNFLTRINVCKDVSYGGAGWEASGSTKSRLHCCITTFGPIQTERVVEVVPPAWRRLGLAPAPWPPLSNKAVDDEWIYWNRGSHSNRQSLSKPLS